MRWALIILVGLLARLGHADEKVVQVYGGTDTMTTTPFTVQDDWEVRWDCPDAIAVSLLRPDGAIVAGGSGAMKGSLYQPRGGTFTLQIGHAGTAGTSPWHVVVVELDATARSGANAAVTYYIPPAVAPTAPAAGPPATNSAVAPFAPVVATVPPSTNAPAAATVTPVPAALTEDEAHAVVVIKGDVMEGTGFLVHTPDGPAVVTNLHVISANPNVKILTTTGKQIKTLSLKGASDRDLAMFMIQDDGYSYLDLATNIETTVQNGDEVITPGNSEGGEVVLNTTGTVLGLGPERIEFSNPIYHGNSGGPVFHTKSGKVLAVVTMATKMRPTDALDKASFGNKASAITGAMRYFGLRLDTVPKWEVYDWNRFLNETIFLKHFHDQSRFLDSFMNGAGYERAHLATGDENAPPDSHLWSQCPKLQSIHDNFHQLSTDSDQSQKLDAMREQLMDVQGFADADMQAVENPANFYSFDAIRAAEEIRYRKALRGEVDKFGDKVSDMGH